MTSDKILDLGIPYQKEIILPFQYRVTPNIESDHIIKLLLQGLELFGVLLCVQVAGCHWLFEEILAVLLVEGIQQYPIEILIHLT